MLHDELSRHIWSTKYRYRPPSGAPERSIEETWHRVANAVAAAEPREGEAHARAFAAAMRRFRFMPAGRILAGAGTSLRTTLFNCFVMGVIDDSIESIFDHLKQGAVTMQCGGGIGVDFSTLRPRGNEAAVHGTIASGPVSFMRVWDAMCATLLSTGARRGAMMGTLRCDHPDIEEFIDAKRDSRALRNFNVSVQVTDALMTAVAERREWELRFAGRAVQRVDARTLWRRITDAAYDSAEPGVLFVDRINAVNNLHYRERITTTNPCGEIPLPPYGACCLGSINLAAFVRDPFLRRARLDLDAIERLVPTAVRFLDDVIDVSTYPLPEQAEQARATRRIGLGVTGLADALIMLGQPYDAPEGRETARRALETIRDAAYRASIELAAEKGPFPAFERAAFLDGPFVASLAAELRDGIARSGLRNSHLLAIAPTGTISLLANNVSSGIEPVYAFEGTRRVLNARGEAQTRGTTDFAYATWQRERNGRTLPASFISAAEVEPEAHLLMLAELQPCVDNSISKTINVAEGIRREDFAGVYERAYALGLKGCTVFRPNPITGSLLAAAVEGPHCCSVEREGD